MNVKMWLGIIGVAVVFVAMSIMIYLHFAGVIP